MIWKYLWDECFWSLAIPIIVCVWWHQKPFKNAFQLQIIAWEAGGKKCHLNFILKKLGYKGLPAETCCCHQCDIVCKWCSSCIICSERNLCNLFLMDIVRFQAGSLLWITTIQRRQILVLCDIFRGPIHSDYRSRPLALASVPQCMQHETLPDISKVINRHIWKYNITIKGENK